MREDKVITGGKAINMLNNFPGITKSVISSIYRRNKRLTNIERVNPPTKGVFVKKIKEFGFNWVLNWTEKLKRDSIGMLKANAKKDSRYFGLEQLEGFQTNQKGPVAPIDKNTFIDKTMPALIEASSVNLNSIMTDKDLVESISEVDSILKDMGFYGKLDYYNIDFAEKLNELPSSSVRGLPFLGKGKDVDEDIIKEYGNDLTSVLRVFFEIPFLLATPALRYQGSPGKDPAKVRCINIPCMGYTYPMNGIYKSVQEIFKNWVCFAAWLEPNERNSKINDMVIKIRKKNWRILSLDYRQYDAHLCPELRLEATKLVLKCFKNTEISEKIIAKLDQLYHNQYLCAPTSKDVISLVKLDNQLLSGISNTQLDGSLINLILQRFIARKFGYSIPMDEGLALGDDTGLPMPVEIIEKNGGYENVLKIIKEDILNKFGMDSHDKKAYPNDNLLFLQNLYQPQDDIIAQYSICRTIDSLVWSEQFRENIIGVKNHNALETIGQITIVNNPVFTMGKINEIEVTKFVLRRWLQIDDALLHLCHECLSRSNPVNYLMNYLISASGGKDVIVRAFRLKQNDTKGILSKLESGEFSQAFPVIPLLLEVSQSLKQNNSDITSIYEQKTSPEFDIPGRTNLVGREYFA